MNDHNNELRRGIAAAIDAPGVPKKTFFAFFIVSLLIILSGYRYYVSERDRASRDKGIELAAIAELKERQIEAWRMERLSDANFIFNNDFISKSVLNALMLSDPGFDYASHSDWMRSMFKNQHYETIALFDRLHTQRTAIPNHNITKTPALEALLDRAVSEKRIIFSDFYRDAANRPMLSVAIPLLISKSDGSRECAGLTLLQIDPQAALFPLMQAWPIPSASGEFVVFRRDGDSVVLLNTLRFSENLKAWKKLPLGNPLLLAGHAYSQTDSVLHGIDYRGEHAFAVVRSINGTPWKLEAKYDAKEVYAQLQQTQFLLVTVVVMILFTGSISILFVWRHRRSIFYRKEYERELERRLSAAALRESEERFSMLVQSLNEIVFTLDTKCRIIGVYGSWVERLGLNAVSVKGKMPEEIFGNNAAMTHQKMAKRALDGEHVLYESTYTDSNTSEVRDVQTSLSPLRDQNGEIIGVVGVGRDITKMKHLERDLLQSQKMDSLGKLAGGIAHDFNNLLSMLMGSAELLKRSLKDDPANLLHVKRIFEATERGSSIAKRLLLFSRQDDAEFQPVSLTHILNEVREILRYSFPKTIDVKLEILVENAIVNGDAGHLHQAFLNLCINAKDAMGDQGTLTMTERMAERRELAEKFPDLSSDQYVAVSVADTGAGIDPSLSRQIFEPFFTTKEKGKGTGLGLSIVDGIMRDHHGFVDVQSEKGKGTVFTLYFPAYDGALVEKSAASEEIKGRGETILVVDDENLIRDMLAEYLEGCGYAVISAGDALEALSLYKAKAGEIDIVITDLGMPKMSGEELFMRLREIDPDASVIISSGYLDGATRNGLILKGVLGILTKPYKLNEIQQLLNGHLTGRKRRKA
ncbi:MAG TPA: ATP-binding protein [Bacteroidota bacterium]|nr:ATP-binding protein [Bacteroidota bacterium]